MKSEDISVDMRLARPEGGKTRAFADVTIPLGSDGVIRLSGFSVIQPDGQSPRVAPPARKGKQRYFEIVALIGRIRSMVDAAILTEYDRQAKSQVGKQGQ